MMITLVLSSNMKRMLKDNVLVRRLVGIETAGSLNVLLTDKTGTLTTGVLKANEITLASGKKFYTFNEINKEIKSDIFNSLYYNNESSISENEIIGGNSTDKALMEFVKNIEAKKIKIISRELFSSEKKYSKITIFDEEEKTYIKGASEKILPNCKYFLDDKGNIQKLENTIYIENIIKKITTSGVRVIALAKIINNDNIFIGIVSIKDELRKETKKAVKQIKDAGIHLIMITGDAKDTAKEIAKEASILTCGKDIILTSDEFNKLTDDEIKEKLFQIKVIARALPHDKSRLVKLAQEKNLIVGMTGDGVNDAPALKKADVGFAIGSGSEVAKEASDIVILDNNIFSICKAILYGRTIFKSIRKFIIYQLTVNTCALFLSIVGNLIGINNPITIIQMLWLNMIMDTFAGLAFSFEPPLEEYMDEKPKDKNEAIVNKYMLSEVFVGGLYSAILCILFLKLPITTLFIRNDNKYLMTSYFALFIFIGICNAFNARTSRINIFSNILKNKVFLIIFTFILIVQIFIIYYGGTLFRTYGMTQKELIFVSVLSLTIFPVDFYRKYLLKKRGYTNSV